MGNEFMNLSINANGFSNVQNTAAGHKAEQANKQGKSAFFAGSPVLTTKNQIEQRKKMAQKSALKLVKDAWDNDQAVEKTVASQRQRYAELDAQRTEAKKALAGYEDQEKTLKEQCNVADDSKEQQDLNLLEKRQEYRRGVGEELTRDEWKKLNEIDKQPLTEYQKRALEIHTQAVEEKVTTRYNQWNAGCRRQCEAYYDRNVDRAKEKQQKHEAPDMKLDEMLTLTTEHKQMNGVEQGLDDIKSSMKVLEADLKGIKVDKEV